MKKLYVFILCFVLLHSIGICQDFDFLKQHFEEVKRNLPSNQHSSIDQHYQLVLQCLQNPQNLQQILQQQQQLQQQQSVELSQNLGEPLDEPVGKQKKGIGGICIYFLYIAVSLLVMFVIYVIFCKIKYRKHSGG